MADLTYVYVIFGATVFSVIFRKRLGYIRRSLFLFDTIGIALYTIVGVEKGIAAGFSPIICISLGTMTACFGGVLRDILCNEIPIIFRKEIYATACLLGGLMFFILKYFSVNDNFIYIATAGTIIVIRILAVKYRWSYPPIEK